MTSLPDLRALLVWCEDEGLRIDPRVCLAHSPTAGVHILATASIAPDETLVWIPKHAVLSARNCSIANILDPLHAPYGLDASLVLALALLYEQLLGSRSRWAGYLQSLPSTPVPLALFWGHDVGFGRENVPSSERAPLHDGAPRFVRSRHADDGSGAGSNANSSVGEANGFRLRPAESAETMLEAHEWIIGTEVARELRLSLQGRNGGGGGGGGGAGTEKEATLLEEIRQFWRETAQPLLDAPAIHAEIHSTAGAVCEADFLRAYALVSSRAFIVDAYHGLAMVPIADAFNHTNENHVQLESDYDVCTACGSLKECPHDDEDTGFDIRARTRNADEHESGPTRRTIAESENVPPKEVEEDYCEMVAVAPIRAGEEVHNTYGTLGNAQLLARYGFALDANEHDVLYWDASELRGALAGDRRDGEDDAHPGSESTAAAGAAKGTVGPDPQDGAASLDRSADAYADVGRMLHKWPTFDGWDDSMLVSNATASEGDSTHLTCLLNADGRISHALWIWGALVAFRRLGGATGGATAPNPESLAELATRQLDVEKRMDEDDKEDGHSDGDERDEEDRQASAGGEANATEGDEATGDRLMAWLRELCSVMLMVFTVRRERIAQHGRSTAQLAKVLDVSAQFNSILTSFSPFGGAPWVKRVHACAVTKQGIPKAETRVWVIVRVRKPLIHSTLQDVSDDPAIPIPTRLAITYVLSELSVLDCADASWLALLSKAEQ